MRTLCKTCEESVERTSTSSCPILTQTLLINGQIWDDFMFIPRICRTYQNFAPKSFQVPN